MISLIYPSWRFIVVLFNPLDPFESSFIIWFSFYNFKNAGYTSLANDKVMIYPVFMQIALVPYKFLSRDVKLVEMFLLETPQRNWNTFWETMVFSVYCCRFIELMYCILIDDVNVRCLNISAIVKEDFQLCNFGVM